MSMKCPICVKETEVLITGSAHSKIKVESYCADCDAIIEVIVNHERVKSK